MKNLVVTTALLGFAVSMFAGGAIIEKGEYILETSGTFYYDCLDTDVYNEFSVLVEYIVVETSSGNQVYFDKLLPNQLEGFLIDLNTGEVWDRTKTISPLVERSTGGDATMTMYTLKSVFVNLDTGEKMMVHERYRISTDANGEVLVDNFVHDCRMLGK